MYELRQTIFETGVQADRQLDEGSDDFYQKIARKDAVILHLPVPVQWSRMVFLILSLPNYLAWRFLVMAVAVTDFFVGTTCFFFARNSIKNFIPVYVIVDSICLVDVLLQYVHLCWKSLNKYVFVVKPSPIATASDTISLFAQEVVIASIFGWSSPFVHYCRWVTYQRLRRLDVFFTSLDNVQQSRWKVVVGAFIVVTILFHHLALCVWYEESCHHRRCAHNSTNPWYKGKWSEVVIKKYPYYKNAKAGDWYALVSYIIIQYGSTTGLGDITPTNLVEIIEMSLIILIGYLTYQILFLSFFIKVMTLVKEQRMKYLFQLGAITMYLADVHVNEKLRGKIIEYYNILWERKDGVKTAPYFDSLPQPLRMEIMFDINSAPLRDSLLFQDMREFYLRTFALLVKHEFLLPGDIFYYQGVIKTSMVIVKKGVLEVLSQEDDSSPIIAFKAGTVLGEASLFFSLPSMATVRAAMYTEVQIIHRVDFMRQMINYPVALIYLKERIMSRISQSKHRHRGKAVITLETSGGENFVPIKIFKERLMAEQRREQGLQEIRRASIRSISDSVESLFYGKYLDLYKLSEENSNVVKPVVWLTTKFPWILDSTSGLAMLWEKIVIVIHGLFLVFFPYALVFDRQISTSTSVMQFASDLVCLFDLLLLMISSVVLRHRVLKTFKTIMKYRLKTVEFYVITCTVLPYEHFIKLMIVHQNDEYIQRIVNLIIAIKMLRIIRCFWISRRIEYRSHTLDWIIKLGAIVITIIMIYYGACVLYLYSCFFQVCTEGSWFYNLILRAIKKRQEVACYFYPVASSIMFSTSVIFLMGIGDILPGLPQDVIITQVLIILGLFMLGLVLTMVASQRSLSLSITESYKDKVLSFQKFLEHCEVPANLRRLVSNFFVIQWNYHHGCGRESFHQTAPEYLKMVVNREEVFFVLGNIPLFKGVDVDLLMDITQSVRVQVIPQGTVLSYAGDVDREMFVIHTGSCVVQEASGKVIKRISKGDYFGDIEMLFGFNKFFTVRSITNCKIISLHYKVYTNSLSMFPEEMYLTQMVIKDPLIKKKVKKLEMESAVSWRVRAKIKKISTFQKYKDALHDFISDSFIPTYKCYSRTKGREKFWAPYSKLGKMQFVGCFLMPITIHPSAPLLKFWLCLRFFLLFTAGLAFPATIGIPPWGKEVSACITAVEYTGYLELYLLMHVAYYNKNGLLISHPFYTARNYLLNESFLMDFIAALPVYQIAVIFGHSVVEQPMLVFISPHNNHCYYKATLLLQLYRIFGCLEYVSQSVFGRKNLTRFCLTMPLVIVLLLIGCTLPLRSCSYIFFDAPQVLKEKKATVMVYTHQNGTKYYGYLVCKKNSWIDSVEFEHHPSILLPTAFYYLIDCFMRVGIGNITSYSPFWMYYLVFIALFGFTMKCYIIGFISAESDSSSYMTLSFQQKVEELLSFLITERLNPVKILKIFKYLEYVWNRTAGMEQKELLSELNTALQEDIALGLYEKTLREVPLFNQLDNSFLKVIAKNLREEYYLSDDILIQSYDVQSQIYIILRGSVEILTAYGDWITTIGVGGIFGNIHGIPPGCSSVTFQAEKDVDVLIISSDAFFGILKEHTSVKYVMEKMIKSAGDYILPVQYEIPKTKRVKRRRKSRASVGDGTSPRSSRATLQSEESEASQMNVLKSEKIKNFSQITSGILERRLSDKGDQKRIVPKNRCFACLLFLNPGAWFKFALEPSHIVFQYVWYFTLVISIYNLFIIPFVFVTQYKSKALAVISLNIELIFYSRIFFILHEAYLDKYGAYVTKFKLIAKHYFTDYKRVFWDIVPNLPFWTLCFLFRREDQFFIFTCIRLFHMLRWVYIFQFYSMKSKSLMAKKAPILIAKVVLLFLAFLHYTSLTMYMIIAPFNNFSESSRKDLEEKGALYTYCFCVYYIISTVTGTGVGDIYPLTFSELIFTIALILSSNITSCILIIFTQSIIQMRFQNVLTYEHKAIQLKKFLQNQNLSDHLTDKLWTYVRNMWNREGGLHMPQLLDTAPYVLRCEIMTDIYSVHLRNGYLFQNINEALLQQICGHLKKVVFFAGNYIVQHGDTNASMYWIHRGKVTVLTVHPNLTETKHETLYSHEMFGMAQGLNYGMPHKFSYRAESHCHILILVLSAWEEILNHFPADKEIIYSRMHQLFTIL